MRMITTKETGRNNRAIFRIFSIGNTSHLILTPIKIRPNKPVVMIVNYRIEWKKRVEINNTKQIAQVSFQAKIGASYRPTVAGNATREIQNTTIDASLSQ